jgi:hypothetical protein
VERIIGFQFNRTDAMSKDILFSNGAPMTPADEYRNLAAKLHARAGKEESALIRAEWNYLAGSYERLAEQAEKNHRTDTTDEPILRS